MLLRLRLLKPGVGRMDILESADSMCMSSSLYRLVRGHTVPKYIEVRGLVNNFYADRRVGKVAIGHDRKRKRQLYKHIIYEDLQLSK